MTQPTEQDRPMSAIDEKLSRGIDRWQACDPILMAGQSQAALIFAFRDMKNDILKLYAEAERLQARVAELEKREAAYDIILKVVSNALERAGVAECDNPADAIEMIAKERDVLAAKCAELIHYPDCWDTVAYPALQDALNNIDADYQGCTECAEKALAKLKADAVREFADQTGDHYVINMAIDYNKANQSQEQAHD